MPEENRYCTNAWLYYGDAFESFLVEKGLVCHSRSEPDPESFGNRTVEFGNGNISIRKVLDRSNWSVQVGDVSTEPRKYYHVHLLALLLQGSGPDPMSFPEQTDFIKAHWTEIAALVDPARRSETHARLKRMKQDRLGEGFL
jgi:hypothetical protein